MRSRDFLIVILPLRVHTAGVATLVRKIPLARDQILYTIPVHINQPYRMRLRKLIEDYMLFELCAVCRRQLLEPPYTIVMRRAGDYVAVAVIINVVNEHICAGGTQLGRMPLPVFLCAV